MQKGRGLNFLAVFPDVEEYGEKFDRHALDVFRTMRRIRVEQQTITGFQIVEPIGVPVFHLAFKHVKELDSSCLVG